MTTAEFGWGVLASLTAALVFETIRGSWIVWRLGLGYPNMRRAWVAANVLLSAPNSQPIYEKVLIDRQLGPWFRGKVLSPANDDPAALAGRVVELPVRGRIFEKRFVVYEVHQRWWRRDQGAEMASGMLMLSATAIAASGYTINAGRFHSEPTVYQVKLVPTEAT